MLNVVPGSERAVYWLMYLGRTFRVDRLWLSDKDNLWRTWLLVHICSHLSHVQSLIKGKVTRFIVITHLTGSHIAFLQEMIDMWKYICNIVCVNLHK